MLYSGFLVTILVLNLLCHAWDKPHSCRDYLVSCGKENPRATLDQFGGTLWGPVPPIGSVEWLNNIIRAFLLEVAGLLDVYILIEQKEWF